MYTFNSNTEEARLALDDIFLIKNLIDLNGLNLAQAARLMGVQRSNLSAWMSGKPNVFSSEKREHMLSALGIEVKHDALSGLRHIAMSRSIIHSWAIRTGSTAFFDLLSNIESGELLRNAEVIRIEAIPYGTFSIVKSQSYAGKVFIMLSPFKSASSKLKSDPHSEICVKDFVGSISFDLKKWMDWQVDKPDPAQLNAMFDSLNNKGNQYGFDKKHDILEELMQERERIDAGGLAGLIHELLNEIERLDETNDLLDRRVRESIYLKGIADAHKSKTRNK